MIGEINGKLCIKERSEIAKNGCWNWTGYKRRGYGAKWVNGKYVPAHRIAYQAWKGEIPEGLVVRHTCDNPSCVNPDHLLTGTRKENMADAYDRGRRKHYSGHENPNCRLTKEQLDSLISRALVGDKHQDIADDLGIARTTVSRFARMNGDNRKPRKKVSQ